ncbi:hypothetical protein GQ607_003734 [Colletotrichum asianum]|uniref:Uncharacterized protein n=1 Tax=Colletotrichum asianum TaxID=702518 RepID=A0A8H3ZVW2_9PEZI|nr:hypothetical protein GQ607_003734 [Colletotrichum asianum]
MFAIFKSVEVTYFCVTFYSSSQIETYKSVIPVTRRNLNNHDAAGYDCTVIHFDIDRKAVFASSGKEGIEGTSRAQHHDRIVCQKILQDILLINTCNRMQFGNVATRYLPAQKVAPRPFPHGETL